MPTRTTTRTTTRKAWRAVTFDHEYTDHYCVDCAERLLATYTPPRSCPFPGGPDAPDAPDAPATCLAEHPDALARPRPRTAGHCLTVTDPSTDGMSDTRTDAPAHCAARDCGALLDQLLTREGIAYVERAIAHRPVLPSGRRRALPDGWRALLADSAL